MYSIGSDPPVATRCIRKGHKPGRVYELFGNRILTAINSETGLEQNAALSTGEKMAAYPPLTTYNK